MIAMPVAALGCIAWVYLLGARGGFWRAAERDDSTAAVRDADAWPRVTAVIPARDEAGVIGPNLASLLEQDYPGTLAVIVVDDHSSDATASVARTVAQAQSRVRVTVLRAPALEPGWTGKLSALDHGIRHAEAMPEPADYLLLADADIAHAPGTLRMLVGRAHGEGLLLTSLMAKLNVQGAAERALIPAFVFFFGMLYPFAWVNDRRRTTAAAAGGCMLVHRASLRKAGGLAAIRGELIDDCALATDPWTSRRRVVLRAGSTYALGAEVNGPSTPGVPPVRARPRGAVPTACLPRGRSGATRRGVRPPGSPTRSS